MQCPPWEARSGAAHLLTRRRCPLAFFSIPSLSSSFFFREATACSFLSSPVFFACVRPSCSDHNTLVGVVFPSAARPSCGVSGQTPCAICERQLHLQDRPLDLDESSGVKECFQRRLAGLSLGVRLTWMLFSMWAFFLFRPSWRRSMCCCFSCAFLSYSL